MTTVVPAPRARELRPEFIRAKSSFFIDVQLWPTVQRIDVAGWLSNFTDDEQIHAHHLLNSFMYFPEDAINQLVRRGVEQLSTESIRPFDNHSDMKRRWIDFLDSLLVSFPTDENPNPTDSGFDFVRRLREVKAVDEAQILEPARLIERLAVQRPGGPVLFIDDFVGSGNQFDTTWHRTYQTAAGPYSFSDLQAEHGFSAFYMPLFCTTLGKERLSKRCAEVQLRELHLLDSRYSAISPDSLIWPDALASSGPDFVKSVSERAGIPDTNGTSPSDWRGFASLALTIAFGRFVPDATLPLFYWNANGWKPLLERY